MVKCNRIQIVQIVVTCIFQVLVFYWSVWSLYKFILLLHIFGSNFDLLTRIWQNPNLTIYIQKHRLHIKYEALPQFILDTWNYINNCNLEFLHGWMQNQITCHQHIPYNWECEFIWLHFGTRAGDKQLSYVKFTLKISCRSPAQWDVLPSEHKLGFKKK